MYYAVFRVNGKQKELTTGIPVKQQGRKSSQLKAEAEQRAELMERTAKGDISFTAAVDALRSLQQINGAGEKMPSVREYLTSYKGQATPSAEINRKRAVSMFLEFLDKSADMRLDSLKREQMIDFLRWALKRVSRGTVGLYRAMLNATFNKAIDDGLISRSPLPRKVNLAKMAMEVNPELGADETKRLPFTPEELHKIITSFPAPWNDLALVSFSLAGLRLGDTCTLKWNSLDLKKGIATITAGKTGATEEKPILAHVCSRLNDIRESQSAGELYVFPDMARRYMRGDTSLSTEFTSLLKAFGITRKSNTAGALKGNRKRVSPLSFHSIRHSFVTFGRCNVGVAPDIMRALVGHKGEAIEQGYATASFHQKAHAAASVMNCVFTETPYQKNSDQNAARA